MPFIPHTDDDVAAMLATLGADSIDALFDEIPAGLRAPPLTGIPDGLTEMEVTRLMGERAGQDRPLVCFLGAGAYDHHIPAVVWEIAGRGEFYTAYTPYQAEASQGTLQVIYEFQSMIAGLTAMAVANASLYDGASALGEAILMATRLHGRSRRVLVPGNLHPHYQQVVATLVEHQGIELVTAPFCGEDGHVMVEGLDALMGEGAAALVIQQPNFFGVLEEVDDLVAWARERGLLVIAMVNPVALGLLKPPGQWGDRGVDIVCGDGQPLGAPLSFGGPSFGFIACRQEHIRQMPGRIVGRTRDREGREGFVLTLQAREQHIRRAKATSNICTNQGLMALVATIHLSLLGPQGFAATARACHGNTRRLMDQLTAIPGVTRLFRRPFFHEVALALPLSAEEVAARLAEVGITAGLPLGRYFQGLENVLLTCATETRTEEEIDDFARELARVLGD